MKIIHWDLLSEVDKGAILLRNSTVTDEKLVATVKDILAAVKARGDKALLEYAKQFDKVELNSLVVEEHEYAAIDTIDTLKIKD